MAGKVKLPAQRKVFQRVLYIGDLQAVGVIRLQPVFIEQKECLEVHGKYILIFRRVSPRACRFNHALTVI